MEDISVAYVVADVVSILHNWFLATSQLNTSSPTKC